MKQYGKWHYKRDGVELTVVPGEDDIKVRVRKPKDEAETE